MTRFFAHTWRFAEACKEPAGATLSYAAGSHFLKRGVGVGDQLFILAIHAGGVWLVGRFEVGLIAGKAFAADLMGREVFPAAEYLIASAGSPANLKRLSHHAERALMFAGAGGPKGLAFTAGGRPDPQTLRGLRELTPESAAMLAELAGPMRAYDPPGAGACLSPRRDDADLFRNVGGDGPPQLGE